MDSGLSIRPTANVAQAANVRPDPAPVREAVATQLAASQSVTAVADTSPSRNNPAPAQPQHPQSREIVLDPHSREVIFRVVDVRSGQVVRQVPDEALMRLRAYSRAVAEGRSPNEAQADLEA